MVFRRKNIGITPRNHHNSLARRCEVMQMSILPIIAAILTAILFVFSLTVKGWKRWISILVFIAFFAVQVSHIVNSHRQMTELKTELDEHRKTVKPSSLDLFGYEIKGDKTGAHLTMLHEAIQPTKAMLQSFYDKNYEEAEKKCDELIKDYPYFAGAYFWKGAIAIAQDKDAKCESLWTRAVELEPRNIEYVLLYRNLGILRMKMGNIKGAIAIFNSSLEGGVLLSFEEMKKAEEEQGQGPKNRVTVDECYFLIARAYDSAGQKDSAAVYLEKATKQNPEWKGKWHEQIKIIIP
jgi:hypothetical protein